MKEIHLSKMKNGQSGIVKEITGGSVMSRRLQAMGLRVGKHIVKKSGMFLHGPITVQIGGTQLGMGHGMAGKIIIEVEE